jgi:hypothetical protein
MGSLDLERRRLPHPADGPTRNGVANGPDDGGFRPLKRRRAHLEEQESDLGEHSENAVCRREKNVDFIKKRTGESEVEHENPKKSARSEVDDSVDDMQLESDSDVVQNKSSAARPATPAKRSPQGRGKIGIKHIDLLYERQPQRMVCRMCLCVTSLRSAPSRSCHV